ncbi:hypothetical protein ACLOJK_019854 [Asimina triloba]
MVHGSWTPLPSASGNSSGASLSSTGILFNIDDDDDDDDDDDFICSQNGELKEKLKDVTVQVKGYDIIHPKCNSICI